MLSSKNITKLVDIQDVLVKNIEVDKNFCFIYIELKRKLHTALPSVLSIDEFKGNSSGKKYHCIITDPVSKKVVDILTTRKHHFLSS